MIEKILKMKKEKVNTHAYRKKENAFMRKCGWYGTEYIEGFKFAKIVSFWSKKENFEKFRKND